MKIGFEVKPNHFRILTKLESKAISNENIKPIFINSLKLNSTIRTKFSLKLKTKSHIFMIKSNASKVGELLNIGEIKSRYPEEWVLM
jgi:hydroxyethylthiazole kinase-like sugar kinase family protein